MTGSLFLTKALHTVLKRPCLRLLNDHNIRNCSLWEPDYLVLARQKIPEYDNVNVQIKGYDFVTLEYYQKFIHKIGRIMNLNVTGGWALPATVHKISRVKKGVHTAASFTLHTYERNIQVADAQGHILPLFIEAVITACPAGVTVNVHESTPELEKERYIPDLELKELYADLEGNVKKKKKKQS